MFEKHEEKPERPLGEDEFGNMVEYVDKKGQLHKFKSTDELMRFREEEGDRDNN